MGFFGNIKTSIDDKSSMSVNSITLLISAIMAAIIGLAVVFVLIFDVMHNGYVKTNLTDLGIFLLASGGYVAGSGIPKTIVDSRMKNRSWVEGEKMRIDAEEEVEEYRSKKYNGGRRRVNEENVDVSNEEGEIIDP